MELGTGIWDLGVMTREVGSGSGGRQITLMGNGLQLGNSCWQTREEVGGGEHECGGKRGLVLNSGQEGGRAGPCDLVGGAWRDWGRGQEMAIRIPWDGQHRRPGRRGTSR